MVMYNCSCLARDLTKIFEAYWFLGQEGSSIPSSWPRPFDTRYNQETPMEICLNGTPALAYLAVSWGNIEPHVLLATHHRWWPPCSLLFAGRSLDFTLSRSASKAQELS